MHLLYKKLILSDCISSKSEMKVTRDEVERVGSLTERTALVKMLRNEITTTPSSNYREPRCSCGGGEYDVHHCGQSGSWEPNSRYTEIQALLRKLYVMEFCSACGRRASPGWIRCPYCAKDGAFTGARHASSACMHADPAAPFCLGCGLPN